MYFFATFNCENKLKGVHLYSMVKKRYTVDDVLKRPDNVTKEDWSLYLTGLIAGYSNIPVGMKVYDGYMKVKKIIDSNQHGIK